MKDWVHIQFNSQNFIPQDTYYYNLFKQMYRLESCVVAVWDAALFDENVISFLLSFWSIELSFGYLKFF